MIDVHVKPGSKKGLLVEQGVGGELVVYVRERAVDGAANDAVAALLAKHFGGDRWQSLSVPRNKSAEFNVKVAAGEASQR